MFALAHLSAKVAFDEVNEHRFLTRFSYDMLTMNDLCFGKVVCLVFHAIYYTGFSEFVKNYF